VEVIIVVSKPPDPAVAGEIERAVARCVTPVVVALLGANDVTLEAAAASAVAALGAPESPLRIWLPDVPLGARPGPLRGLFSGGTLRDEARSIATVALGAVAVEPTADGHRLVDYGADEFTRGRAHPMIDQSLRLAALADASGAGAVLLDVVLGYGAHPDPAAELAPVVAELIVGGAPVVVALCGTQRDPQGRDRQAEALRGAGAEVYLSNAAAARRSVDLIVEGGR
jgi:FdrA protein